MNTQDQFDHKCDRVLIITDLLSIHGQYYGYSSGDLHSY